MCSSDLLDTSIPSGRCPSALPGPASISRPTTSIAIPMKDCRVAGLGRAGFAHEEDGGAQCDGAMDLKDMPTPFRVRRRSFQGVFMG